MSVDRNFGRTLSGATDIAIDNLRLGDNINSIRINGNAGLPNQVLAKNGITNKLEWDFAESTTIPEGSITGDKLANNINISTTGNIDAETIRANTFIAPKTGQAIVEINTDNGAGIDINNGADIRMYSDSGGSNTLLLDGNTGTITMGTNSKIQSNGVAEIMRVNNGGAINLYDDNVGASKTIEIVGETGTITCKDLNVNNHTGTIEFNEIKTDKLILPITGTANCEILSSGNIITNGTITGGSIVGTSLASSTTITSTGSITSGGDITINGGNDLLVNSGGKVDLFSDNGTTRTIDIDGATGDLKVYNPSNGNERIELDGTTGNVIINDGGRIDMFLGNTLNIELNGVNGVIDCKDINVFNHTGTIAFANIRTDSLTIPENGAGQVVLNTNGLLISGQKNTGLSAGGCGGELAFLDINGLHGALTLLNRGNVQIIASTGDTPQAGDLTISNGDLDITAGNMTATAGNITATAGNITATAGTFKSAKIGSKPAPEDATYTDWAMNLSDDNSHGYIGGNLIVNGNIYGNVEGTITEEIIDAQRLNLRADPTGSTSGNIELNMNVGANETGLISMDYNAGAIGNSGIRIQNNSANVFEITKTGTINNVQSIIMRGSTFNNTNSANFIMGTQNAIMVNANTPANTSSDKLKIQFGSNSGDNAEILLRNSNINRVFVDYTGIDFNSSTAGYRLQLDSENGDINFKSTIGEINGFNASTPNGMTNMTMFDQSNQLPHPRFVQICDPATHSAYTLTAGSWKNMAGYTDNNPAKPRFTNADLSFTAFSTTGRINVIFSASVNNNMGVRFRIVALNGGVVSAPITGTQRLFIGSSAHRGQHEYTCYYNGFTLGYDYVITPEVYVGGSSNITMYVGSNSGSATIQNADSPIITEITFMNRATINTGNIYVPPADDY
jgi:hypothetical protein